MRPAVNGWGGEYLEGQYEQYKMDPSSVPADVAAFFQGFDLAMGGAAGVGAGVDGGGVDGEGSQLQAAAEDLIAAYRALGHLIAKIDPFGRPRPIGRERARALTLEAYGLSEADLDKPIHTELVSGGTATLGEVIERLERAYCGPIGVEFMHIPSDDERAWFRERFEGVGGDKAAEQLDAGDQRRVLEQLTSVERFEYFLDRRFQGKKRFSIEGAESTIPLLKFMAERAGQLGTQEMIVGMAHRGRLAVLKTFLGKDLGKLFTEFKDAWQEGTNQGGGDVKYHRGYSGDQPLPGGGAIHLSMLNNPSHLESVNPVVMGRCRAKQDLAGDAERRKVVSLLIHGDAAVAGQGVVAECLNMSKLAGYDVGGVLHVVINNLVGFTTDPEDGRSTEYCTDVAKMINAPVLHVNGDDPDAVVRAARLAAEYRHEFRKDVFVDLVCFRKYGHNEQDEPTYTQPALYALVKAHPGTAENYRRRLAAAGVVTEADAAAMQDKEMAELDAALEAAAKAPVDPVQPAGLGLWKGLTASYGFDSPSTAVDAKTIADVCAAMGRAPEGFTVNEKLRGKQTDKGYQPGLLEKRGALPETKRLAHADAEQIAFGTLLLDGVPVRLSGQDVRRGTFTQRQGVLRDEKTGERYTPLNHIRAGKQARYEAWDSPLSEYAVMGFDYGYSRANPRALVLWEGQFGDFGNGAQIMIDQYLASSEVKWHRWAGLVLLLPHGYEGQGPEHSSARLERFLQLCADDNMEVVYPSTAAQTFHMLRRQMLRNFRKPLIVMTPKKYLRVETSTIDELSTGEFRHVIDDAAVTDAKNVTSVVYCTGKLYHELNERRVVSARKDVAIVRVEQLYPLHAQMLKGIDARYPKSAKRVWAQEEPRNQGAYMYIADRFRTELGVDPAYVGRAACASPATGSEKAHGVQQEAILTAAIGPAPAKTPVAEKGGNAPVSNGASSPGSSGGPGTPAKKREGQRTG